MPNVITKVVCGLVLTCGLATAAEPTTRPIAKLSNGTSVELIAVLGRDPAKDAAAADDKTAKKDPLGWLASEDQVWWSADGTKLDAAPFPAKFRVPPMGASANNLVFLVKFTGADANKKPWNALNTHWKANGGGLGLMGVQGLDGKIIPDYLAYVGSFSSDQDDCKITFNFAMKPDAVAAKLSTDKPDATVTEDVPGFGKITLANPREADGKALITATIPSPPANWQVVLVAVPKGRNFIPPSAGGTIGGTGGTPLEVSFNSKITDVKQFVVKIRDYTTEVNFDGVSLHAGHATHPTVEVHEPDVKENEGL